MPIARRYGGQQVGPNALPGVRGTAVKTFESEGGTVAQAKARTWGVVADVAGGVANQAIGAFKDVIEKERSRANETAVLDASNQLDQYENRVLYGDGTEADRGVLAKRGKDALGLPEQVSGEWAKRAAEIEATLSTPEQRAAFARVKAQHSQNLDVTIRRHTAQEIDAYDASVTKAKVDLGINNAIANAFDDRRIAEELHGAEEAVRARAAHTGTDPKVLEQQLAAVRTATHVGVVKRLLQLDKSADASAYYKANKDEIDGEQRGDLEAALEEGGLRKSSQLQADTIIATEATLDGRLEAAKKIDDAKLRDLVTDRIEHQDAIEQRAKRDTAEKRDHDLYNLVDAKGTSLSALMASDAYQQSSGNEREAAKRALERKIEGVPIPNGRPEYYDLMELAGSDDPKDRDKFLKENLHSVRGKISQGDWDRVWSIQQSMRAGDTRKAAVDLGGFRTNQAIASDTLELLGMDPNAKGTGPNANPVQAKKNAQFMRLLDQEVEEWQVLNGKKAVNSDVQEIADKIVRDQTRVSMIDRPWYIGDAPGAVFLGVTVADIPASIREEMEVALNDRRERVTDARLLDLYHKYLAKPKK